LEPGLDDQRQPGVVIVLRRLHADENVIQFGDRRLGRRSHRSLGQIVEQLPVPAPSGQFRQQGGRGSLTDLDVAEVEAAYVLADDDGGGGGGRSSRPRLGGRGGLHVVLEQLVAMCGHGFTGQAIHLAVRHLQREKFR